MQHGGVAVLVQALRVGATEVQAHAAEALANLASVEEHSKRLLVR